MFALPGERCVADLNGDFKVHFNDRHGDFYWCVGPVFTSLITSIFSNQVKKRKFGILV